MCSREHGTGWQRRKHTKEAKRVPQERFLGLRQRQTVQFNAALLQMGLHQCGQGLVAHLHNPAQHMQCGGAPALCCTPCVTFRRVVAPLRGHRQSPVLPFACCVGSLRSVGRCGRCSCWCRFRVRGAQWFGVLGLCWMWRDVLFARQWRPIIGVLRMCWLLPGSFDCFCCPHTSVHRPSIACLAVFPCGPGALFLHALSPPSTLKARKTTVRRGPVPRQARACAQRAVPKECTWRTPAHTSPQPQLSQQGTRTHRCKRNGGMCRRNYHRPDPAPFSSTIGAQPGHGTFLTTKTTGRRRSDGVLCLGNPELAQRGGMT